MPRPFGPMTIGEVAATLETIRNPDNRGYALNIAFDWGGGALAPDSFHSYRGYYDHLAVWISDRQPQPLAQFALALRRQIGAEHAGYNGGTYRMREDTPLWVAPISVSTGWGIAGVRDDDWIVTLVTECFDR